MRVTKIRKLTSIVVFVMFILIPGTVGSALADTQYVSDMLILCLRAGPGNEYKVIRNLKTDAPLEVLEEDELYLKVRTDQGEEGWVLRQYISSKTPKPIIIAALKRDIKQLEATVEKLEERHSQNPDLAESRLPREYRQAIKKFINNNIEEIVNEKHITGGRWVVTNLSFLSPSLIQIDYEDGHNAGQLVLTIDELKIIKLKYHLSSR